MDFPRLRELEQLWGHRWDALALLCLASAPGPLRYAHLAQLMDEQSDERLVDGAFNRSLRRLTDAGLVQSITSSDRHSPYTLTPAGAQTARRLQTMLTALRQIDTPAGSHPEPEFTLHNTPAAYTATTPPQAATAALPVPPEADPDRPSPARVYDYFLGGTHNLDIDRRHAEALIAADPRIPLYALANRSYLQRVVRLLLDAGVRQFLDIGSGIPTVGNVHEVAQTHATDTRVVYVDINPAAVAYSRLILARTPNVGVVQADVRDLDTILTAPPTRELIDFEQPVGVLMIAVLHFVDDITAVSHLHKTMNTGSYLALSHASPSLPTAVQTVSRRQHTSRMRSRTELLELMTGFELVDPGLVAVHHWRPGPHDHLDLDPDVMLACVGRKP